MTPTASPDPGFTKKPDIQELWCTPCSWSGKLRKGKYRAKSPTGSWHTLCRGCHILYGEKYDDFYQISPLVRENLLAGRAPFAKKDT